MDEKVKRGRKPNQKPTEAQKKVTEVVIETPKPSKELIPEPRVNRNIHEVIVNGNSRMMSKQAYEAIRKDPNRTVELPMGSRLAGGPTSKPCKDC